MESHFLAAIGVILCTVVSVGATGVIRSPAQLAADNSRQNVRFVRTAQNQPNDPADRMIAAKVRRLLVADETLSVYGKNVKILVIAGKVTLEGPVHSRDEELEVAFDAATIVGRQSIDDRITFA